MIFEMCIDDAQYKFLNSELRRVSRSEAIMTNFARALWTVLKQYKHKLLVILSAYFFFILSMILSSGGHLFN